MIKTTNTMLKKGRTISLMIVFCSMFSILSAKNIYVAPEGKNYTSSSIASSYDDPVKFSSIFTNTASMPTSFLISGDTIYFKGGQYDLAKTITLVQANSGGVENKRTVMKACPGEVPVFDFRKQPYGKEVTGSDNVGFKVPANYADIIGLRICYAGKNGMLVSGSHNVIENCTFYGNGNSGLQMKDGGDNLIKNCDSYLNFDYKTMSGTSPDYGQDADGFADKQYTSPSSISAANTYIGCRSWENSDDGWDFYARITIDGYPAQIKESWCFKNAPAEYDMTNHPRYEIDKEWFDQFKNTDGKIIVKNYGNGNGFKMGGNKTKNDVILTRCISFNNKEKGFDQNNNAGSMTIYNCTSYNNNLNFGFGNKISGAKLTIKNCASVLSKSSDSFNPSGTASDYVHNNNSWDLNIRNLGDSDFASVDITHATDPRNADGSLPDWAIIPASVSAIPADTNY